MNRNEWLLLILLSFLWGGSFFFIELGLKELPPFTIVFARLSIAAVALYLYVLGSGLQMPSSWTAWQPFFIMGLFNNLIPYSFIVWGQTQITSGLASILNATTPLFTILYAHFLTQDEQLTANKLLGVALGLIGVTIMIGMDAIQGIGENVIGQIAVLCGSNSYAFAVIYGRRFKNLPPVITATGQTTAAAILIVPIVMFIDTPWTLAAPGLTTWSAILGLAISSTAVAVIIYFRLLASAGATNLVLVTFLIPITAVILGITLLDEQLQINQLAGMGLIILGIAAVDGRILKMLFR